MNTRAKDCISSVDMVCDTHRVMTVIQHMACHAIHTTGNNIDPNIIMVQNTFIYLMDHPNNLVSDSKVTGPEVKDQGHPEVIETLFNVDTIWIMLLCTV